jgi:hypothetical protein
MAAGIDAARWFAAPLGLASMLLAGAAAAQEAATATPEDHWVVSATAYAWATSVDGHARVGGQKAEVDMPFSDLLKDLTLAGMGTVAARHGRFGFYVSPFFGRTRSDEGGGNIEARVRSDTTMLGLGGMYRLLDWEADPDSSGPRGGQLEALAGVRITDLRTEINGRHGLPKFDDDKTWVDPVVGLGGRLQLTDRWETFAEGDIGGFGVGSDLTWNWVAGIGYGFELFGHASFVRAGYRMLYQDYKDGGFEWDVTYKGPTAGLTTRF